MQVVMRSGLGMVMGVKMVLMNTDHIAQITDQRILFWVVLYLLLYLSREETSVPHLLWS